MTALAILTLAAAIVFHAHTLRRFLMAFKNAYQTVSDKLDAVLAAIPGALSADVAAVQAQLDAANAKIAQNDADDADTAAALAAKADAIAAALPKAA